MSHSSKEAAVLATVSITEAALEEALAQVEEMMAHRRLLRLQHQKQQPWGTCCNKMAVTFVTHEVEAAR